jgi:arylsulfatase A-like enzyme
MKCIMVMFDSLNRHMLPPYAADTWLHAPNFQRLARRCATFDRSYVCSMPCMPARRDFHTGRPNFLHNAWGPLEAYDDSVPQMLQDKGVYTHLTSDHYHYWEDGGATYHGRYNTWEFFRGQEGDPFIGQVADPVIPPNINGKGRRADWVNRMHIRSDEQYPQSQTFAAGVKFIDRNAREDNWFLQIECFDPHEPFTTDRRWRDLYPSPDDDATVFDWPNYAPVKETPQQVEKARRNYAALVSKCDASLGDVLDAMDRHDLWKDTMLVVWTDHGFLLGEHDCWAKNWMPLYEEIAHTPFFMHDPREPGAAGQRRSALVQPAIDLGPTLLRFFGLEPTRDMLGHDLAGVIRNDAPVREAAIFGYHSQKVNVTDGRYVYMRAGRPNGELYRYTLMPVTMRGFANCELLGQATLAQPFSFTKGAKLLRFGGRTTPGDTRTLLWDVQNDPQQTTPLTDPAVEQRMIDHMTRLMRACDAPAEQFDRLGIA